MGAVAHLSVCANAAGEWLLVPLSVCAIAVGEWLMAVAPGILIRVYGTSCVVVGFGTGAVFLQVALGRAVVITLALGRAVIDHRVSLCWCCTRFPC